MSRTGRFSRSTVHANGIDLQQPLTPELAATLTIPR
jgi:hypothetical protein